MASRFAPAAKLDRIRALGARLKLVDGDFDTARERAAAIARGDGIRRDQKLDPRPLVRVCPAGHAYCGGTAGTPGHRTRPRDGER